MNEKIDTLIPVSGGWRSAYLLAHWLRTHPGRVAAFHCRLGDGLDRGRSHAHPEIIAWIESRYPGRVEWRDSSVASPWPAPGTTESSLIFLVSRFLSAPDGQGIKNLVLPRKMGLGGKNVKELIQDTPVFDAITEIPQGLWPKLNICRNGIIHCGECADCKEVMDAKKEVMG